MILFPQTYNLLIKKLCCMCLKTNEAVIKMIIKGRSSTMRHVSKTHRVALDWLFDRINLDSKIQIKYMESQTLTTGNFTRDERNHLLCLSTISHFSSTYCLEVSKRTQKNQVKKESQQNRSRMMILVSRCSERTPDVLPSTVSESRGEDQT